MSIEAIPDDLVMPVDEQKRKIADMIRKMTPEERASLARIATPRLVEPYIKHIPHPVQQAGLAMSHLEEVMYGGAAGGGKSDWLLMAALQYVDVPGYSALILRRTWPDLNAPGAILDRCRTWLSDTDAKQKEQGRIWEFPGGGRLQFGYLQHDKDKFKFQSAEYQFIGFDELTHFQEDTYHYMFSRVRRPTVSCLNCSTAIRVYRNSEGAQYWKHTTTVGKKCKKVYPDPKVIKQYGPSKKDGLTLFDVPLRMRSATNPGGVGHQWVKRHFIDEETKGKDAVFLSARLMDNPSIDQESYVKNLMHLLPVDRERLLNGDWDVEDQGDMFARHHFNVVDQAPQSRSVVRYWDLAATAGGGDYTVGVKMLHHDGRWYVIDVVRGQWGAHEIERIIRQTAMLDGTSVPIRMEQEPGSSGKNIIDHYRRNILSGFDFDGLPSSGDKETRAYPLASSAQAGNLNLVAAPWNKEFIDECVLFPFGANDDQVDCAALAQGYLAFGKRSRLIA